MAGKDAETQDYPNDKFNRGLEAETESSPQRIIVDLSHI
jgi:hypothetical protein